MPWGGHPLWTGPLTTSLRGLWVSGYLSRAIADRARGRRPENRPGGDDSDPGLASRRERGLNCQQTCYSRTSVDCSIRKGAGAQRPHTAKGRDPRTPASWRHLLLRVVAATSVAAYPSDTTLRRHTTFSGTIWVDGRTRQLSHRTTGQACRGQFYQVLGVRGRFTFSSAVVFQFQIASFETPSVRENVAQFLFWVSLVLWRSTLSNGW